MLGSFSIFEDFSNENRNGNSNYEFLILMKHGNIGRPEQLSELVLSDQFMRLHNQELGKDPFLKS